MDDFVRLILNEAGGMLNQNQIDALAQILYRHLRNYVLSPAPCDFEPPAAIRAHMEKGTTYKNFNT